MFGNPGDAANLTAAAIAQAIGADISGQAVRLVDNKPVAYTASANLTNLGAGPVPVLTQVDVSSAVMVTVNLANILAPTGSTALATAPTAGQQYGFDLLFTWYDATGTVVLFSEIYEINCNARPPVGQAVVSSWQATIPARGALLSVTAINPLATLWATGVGGGFALTLTTSSRVVPTTLRGYADGSALDGLLLTASGTLTVTGGATPNVTLMCNPTRGRLFLSLLGANTLITMDGAWGLARTGLMRDSTTWPASGAGSRVYEFPATNRPLSLKIANTSATLTAPYNVAAWTAPNAA